MFRGKFLKKIASQWNRHWSNKNVCRIFKPRDPKMKKHVQTSLMDFNVPHFIFYVLFGCITNVQFVYIINL